MHFSFSCYQGQQCLNVMVENTLKLFSMAIIFGLACCLKFMSHRMKGQVSIPSSRSCEGRLNMLLKKLTVNVPQLALVAGDISLLVSLRMSLLLS